MKFQQMGHFDISVHSKTPKLAPCGFEGMFSSNDERQIAIIRGGLPTI